ncbi:MAG: hypothetical protein PHE88_11685 [Elusimicrobia bacterium]|nr:hypothetical protein [Elusimicrobiota bacterium]
MATAQDICTFALSSILNDDASSTPASSDLNLALSTLTYLMDYWQLDPQTTIGLREFVFTPATGTQSLTIGADISVTLTSASTVATATTTQEHGRIVGDIVIISGASPAAYNGTYTVVSVPTSTTFTYAFAGGTSPATGTILVSADITTAMPPRLENASFCRLGGVDFLIGFASAFDEYNSQPVKSNQGYPTKCWYNPQTTSQIARFYLWPASNGAELHLMIRQVPLSGFASMALATTLTLPMGLEKPLIDCLAAELLDSYNVPQPAYSQVKQKAANSLRKWKRSNLEINVLQMPSAVANRSANNYTA